MLLGNYEIEDWDDHWLVLSKKKYAAWGAAVGVVLAAILVIVYVVPHIHSIESNLFWLTILALGGGCVVITKAVKLIIEGDHVVFDGNRDEVTQRGDVVGKVSDMEKLDYRPTDIHFNNHDGNPYHQSKRYYSLYVYFRAGNRLKLMTSSDISRINETAERIEAIFGTPINLDELVPQSGLPI